MIGKILEQFFFCKEEPRSDCGNQAEPVLSFKVRFGSEAVFPNSVQNVRSWVKSGPQFRATELPNLAEGVEQVPTVGIFETMNQNPGRC